MNDRQVELIVYRGEELVQRINLQPGSITFGRSEDCDLCLPDISVSRRHGQITLTAEEVIFEDLGSGNGSWFKGQRIRSQLLEDGDEVLVEPFRLQVEFLLVLDTATDVEDPGEDRTVMLQKSDAEALLREEDYPDARLEVLSGDVNLGSIDLEGQLLSMGRSEQRDVILKDKAASRLHCEILPLKGSYWLRDSGSANGVKVNGNSVSEHQLQDGDVIRIGETEFRFLSDDVLGSKTDVLGGETSTQSDGDHTEAFVNVMEPNVGWSLDSPAAEEPSPQAFATPMPPAFPAESVKDPDATIEPVDDNAPPIYAPLPDAPADPEPAGFGEAQDNSVDYGISPDLGDTPQDDWGFGGPLSQNRDGSLKAQKAPGSGIFGNWVRTTIVFTLAASVGLVGYKKLSDAGLFASSGPKGISQAVYMQPTSDPNIMARTNQLMSEGAEAFSSEQYFEAFQKYHKVVQIEPSNETARREQIRACEMVAVDRLKGKISADEATADQRRAAKQEAVEAAQNAVENRRNSVVCRSALSKVNKALALNPNDAELEEWKSKINRRISALIREGQRVTKESIAEGMRPLIASGGRNFSSGRFASAISDYSKALSMDPNRTNIDLVQQAEEGLERAKNKRRSEARRHYSEGARFMNSADAADLRRARQSFRQALGIDPEYDAAKTKLNSVMSKLRSRAKEEYDRGKVMRQASQYELARLHFQKVLTLLDDPSDSLYRRAQEEITSMGPG